MLSDKKIVSPSRTYVAVCNKPNFDGHYMRKFTLPETLAEAPDYAQDLYVVHQIVKDGGLEDSGRNDATVAAWYFLNVLNHSACIEGCIAFEDYSDLKDELEVQKKMHDDIAKFINNVRDAAIAEATA